MKVVAVRILVLLTVMKVSHLLVLLVITWCMIDESEGARRRRRFRRVVRRVVRRVTVVCHKVCSYKCVTYCSKCAPVCGIVCNRVCGGKRSEVSTFIVCPFDLYIKTSIQFNLFFLNPFI